MPDSLAITKERLTRAKQLFTITSESLGGKLIVTRPLSWPSFEELTFSIENLTKTQLDLVMAFIENHQGIKVDIIKTYNAGISDDPCADNNEIVKTWRGYITNSRTNINEQRWLRSDGICTEPGIYNVVLSFQGNLVTTP